MDFIKKAREILEIEAQGIQQISTQLDASFNVVVEACLECLKNKGKLVLSGIGKSGQVAQKIASTLASTGSTAIFIHPVEALHGDLGMIRENDLFLCFSYSGESEELFTIIPHLQRLNIITIAICGNENSKLSKKCDYSLKATINKEACPFNLAPTTSTTATMALGDALALVLMEHQNFKLKDYGLIHPAGSIGRSTTLLVKEVMRKGEKIAIIQSCDTVHDAIIAMCNSQSGCCLISDEKQELLGIFTNGDLNRSLAFKGDVLTKQINNFMTKKPHYVFENSLALDILKILDTEKINELPVLDKENKIVGLVEIQDLPKFKII